MAYLQQFLLPSTSHLAIKEKITRHNKGKKTQFEEIKQASEQDSDMTGFLELSEQQFKITIIW